MPSRPPYRHIQLGPNRWKGFVLGALGSAAGLAAMDVFFGLLEGLSEADADAGEDEEAYRAAPAEDGGEDAGGSDREEGEIAAAGHALPEERDATVLAARELHRSVTGHDPGRETEEVLGSLVHYGHGALMGGFYGAARGDTWDLDARGGALWGTTLWLLGDELLVPMLGLSEGPAERPVRDHAEEWAAHLVYGIVTAAATQALHRVF